LPRACFVLYSLSTQSSLPISFLVVFVSRRCRSCGLFLRRSFGAFIAQKRSLDPPHPGWSPFKKCLPFFPYERFPHRSFWHGSPSLQADPEGLVLRVVPFSSPRKNLYVPSSILSNDRTPSFPRNGVALPARTRPVCHFSHVKVNFLPSFARWTIRRAQTLSSVLRRLSHVVTRTPHFSFPENFLALILLMLATPPQLRLTLPTYHRQLRLPLYLETLPRAYLPLFPIRVLLRRSPS